MIENAPVERLDKITIHALFFGKVGNAGQQLAFTFCVLQWQPRIGFQSSDVGHDALTFGQGLDQTKIDIVQAAAE